MLWFSVVCFFFVKQKTAYERRISDWSSDVCSSDLFDSIEEVNELLDTLVQGLWNDLTRHQKRSQPFRLTRPSTEPTAVDLGQYGLVRLQELDGFIEGLFNGEDVIDLPE